MIALIAVAAAYLTQLAIKVVLARVYVNRQPAPAPRASFPGVTILQPVLGGDPELAAALARNLDALDGASFVWLLDEDDREGRSVCEQLQAAGGGSRVKIVLMPPVPPGLNPKVFKLARAEAGVVTPYVVVLDDDTRLSARGLAALIEALDDHDVSTALPLYLAGNNAPSRLVAQFVNTQSVITYLPPLVFGPAITLNGMAYALRTTRLRELGGFAPLVGRLTDDLAVARLVREAGGRIRQTIVPLAITTTVPGWRRYARVMHRWFVFAWLQVRAQSLPWRGAIVLAHGTPPLLLWAVLVLSIQVALARGDWIAPGVLVATLSGRNHILGTARRLVARDAAGHAGWSLLAELLQPFHLVHALLSRTIHWRSRVIEVRADDDFSIR